MSTSEGRRFGLAVGLAFGFLAVVMAWRSHALAAYAAGVAGAVLVLGGLVAPRRLGPLHASWMGLARLISRVTTPLIMGLIYFLVITPTALALRAFKRNPLERRRSADGFWIRRSAPGSDLERQF